MRATAKDSYDERYTVLAIADALEALFEINRHRDRAGVSVTFHGNGHPGVEATFREFAKKHAKLVELEEDKANDALYLMRLDTFITFASWYRSH